MFTKANGAQDGVVKIAIVMTDEETNYGLYDGELTSEEVKEQTQMKAKIAKRNGVYKFALGVGDSIKVN